MLLKCSVNIHGHSFQLVINEYKLAVAILHTGLLQSKNMLQLDCSIPKLLEFLQIFDCY